MVQLGTLIVGASQAGLQIASSLRELGYAEPITLVGSEMHPPYQRPPLSKGFLAGDVEADGLAFRSPTYYADHAIELVRGELVTGVRFDEAGAEHGGVARAESGREFAFAQLALAVGGRPRRLEIPGKDLDGVSYLRDMDDAIRLRTLMPEARSIVVLGGGFIGLEAAAAARAQDKRVTVVEAADRLIGRAVAPVVSEFYLDAHRRRGVDVRLDTTVTEILGEAGRVTAVRLHDGAELPADLVLVGIGMLPRIRLAESMGLKIETGIVVDEHARTSVPTVVAAGDCTVLPHPMTGVGRVRLESVQNAVAQARVAAATLAGKPDPLRTVPWFWSDQGDLKLQIAGLNTGYDRTVVRGEPSTESFAVLYYRGHQLLSVDAVNAPRDYLVVRKALTDGSTVDPARAGDADVPLKELLVAAPQRASA
ncbi:MAG: FAD-dependent oxidoreductase [Nocardioidaceae bacterium]|nr:FAD-dependent oxidoreductase [Nocardioidaceae bacterium]